MGLTDAKTRSAVRKVEQAFSTGVVPKKMTAVKLNKAQSIQKEMLSDMLDILKYHPYTHILEQALDKEQDMTLADLEAVIKKDKMSTCTGGEQGLTNFENMIQQYFDRLESRIVDCQLVFE